MAVNNSFLFEYVKSTHQNLVIDSNPEFKKDLSVYRAFTLEGENLARFCEERPRVYYKSRFDKSSVSSSIVATMQWDILKMTVAAIRSYTKALEIDEEGYENISKNLISNSCSQNISVVSHRKLKKMFIDIKKDPDFLLPDISSNPFYTSKISKRQSRQEILARELYYTIGLFKVACSWGQDVDYLRGLEQLINNPIVASYVIREMSGLEIPRSVNAVELGLSENVDTTRVHCDNLICRQKKSEKFLKDFPKSIGQQSIVRDLKSVYCSDLRLKSKSTEYELSESMQNIYSPYLGDEGHRLVGQYIALVTKIPDFNVWTDNKKILGEYIKDGLDHFWDGWSKRVLKNQSSNLKYEEPLTLDVVDHKKFLSPINARPKVQLDLNSGEFDKIISINGKIKYKFDVEILDRDLLWLYSKYRQIDPTLKEEIALVDNLLTQYIEKNFSRIKSEFSNYLISGEIVNLIKDEIKAQLRFISTIDVEENLKILSIPIEINISPFALVYLKNKKIMQNELLEEKAVNEQFMSIKRIDSMATKSK